MMRPELELDIENLVGFFSAQFRNRKTGELIKFVRHVGSPPLDLQALVNLLATHTIVTFNGNNYDLPILVLALYGADNATLKKAGDDIIVRQMKSWEFYRKYQIEVPAYIDHVDLIEVAAGIRIGLKMYAGRMHYKTMQDLPVDPNTPVAPVLYQDIITYCDNDLGVTGEMRAQLEERLTLRNAMSEKYGVDLRSKSDAQIAEAVIRARILEGTGQYWIDKRVIPHGYSFKYEPPAYIQFATPAMRAVLELVRNADFIVSDKEEAHSLGMEEVTRTGVIIPEELKGRDIVIGAGRYRLGIGGLHSQESATSHFASDAQSIVDIDVKSYYPTMILNMGMYPEQLGPRFLEIYREIYTTRLTSKDKAKETRKFADSWDGDARAEFLAEATRLQTESDGLKIVLNGTFGKLFSKYSVLYAPEFGIRTTLTGQLSLLMLIEMMELSGIRVVSANTDGIVLLIPKGREWIARSNVAWWERTTNMEMEESHYKSLHSRDVNNYVAITVDGDVKRKGVFGKSGINKNKHPDKDICAEAVIAYLKDRKSVYDTIRECTDIRMFLQVRNVKGGGVYIDPHALAFGTGKPEYLGRAVRWYYAQGSHAHIEDTKSGNMVAGTKGCKPLMTLPDTFPTDVDYAHYTDVALEMLADIGMPVHYWHHPESDAYFITTPEDIGITDGVCDEITRKQYEKGAKR